MGVHPPRQAKSQICISFRNLYFGCRLHGVVSPSARLCVTYSSSLWRGGTSAPPTSSCKLKRATLVEVDAPVSSLHDTSLPIFVSTFIALKMGISLLMAKVWKMWS